MWFLIGYILVLIFSPVYINAKLLLNSELFMDPLLPVYPSRLRTPSISSARPNRTIITTVGTTSSAVPPRPARPSPYPTIPPSAWPTPVSPVFLTLALASPTLRSVFPTLRALTWWTTRRQCRWPVILPILTAWRPAWAQPSRAATTLRLLLRPSPALNSSNSKRTANLSRRTKFNR